jgi:hypothetical protein
MADILNAIDALYGGQQTSGADKQTINQHLIEWQRLPASWTAAFELLHLTNNPNAQFFGALTLNVKIKRDLYVT